MSAKIEKFPEWSEICADPSVIDAYEAYRKKAEEWRVKRIETLEKRLLTIIQGRDEVGTKVTMMRFHTLLNHVLESLKSE